MVRVGKAFSLLVALLATSLFLVACDRSPAGASVAEVDEAAFRRAKDLLARNLNNEALANFQKLIIQRGGEAPESHLEAGLIHLNHIKDPVSAIYHFNRYKALVSQAGPAQANRDRLARVDELIKTASKDFLKSKSLASQAYQEPLERLKLLDTIEQLRAENAALNARLTAANDRLRMLGQAKPEAPKAAASVDSVPSASTNTPAAVTPSAPTARPAAPASSPGRQYTVQPGDTLSKISRKFYGDSSRWREIFEANAAVLPDSSNLSVGTTLTIP